MTQTMKKSLLVFTENYGRGGGNSYLIDMFNGVQCMYDTTALAGNPGALHAEELARLNGSPAVLKVPIRTIPWAWTTFHGRSPRLALLLVRLMAKFEQSTFAYNVALLRRLIRRVRPTAVLACNGGFPAAPSALAMVVAAHREGVPAILSIVSVPEPRRSERIDADMAFDQSIWESAVAVVVNVSQIAHALEELRGMPAGLARVVRNGLPDRIVDSPRKRGSDALTIGCVSRLEALKGTDVLVDAFSRVAQRRSEARLVLVGEGNGLEAAREALAQHGLSDRSSVPGWYKGDVDELVATFDIYAFPSLWEGLPYSILEAMRAGRAIVATRVGGIPEAIIDGETGLLVEAGSVDALADGIERLAQDSELRARLGAAARERFLAEFCLDTTYTRFADVFRSTGMA
jgi:glycosyltransferase involved in cell wall biosynthesis